MPQSQDIQEVIGRSYRLAKSIEVIHDSVYTSDVVGDLGVIARYLSIECDARCLFHRELGALDVIREVGLEDRQKYA